MVQFSLVSTVFNEAGRLAQTLADIELQTLKPSEIIITDAGSTDGTYERLLEWKTRSKLAIKILQKHKCNVAEGRNIAIREAQFPLIASTDFGCRFHRDWLKSLIESFENEQIQVVGGAFSVLESEVKTIAARADYILSKGYLQPLEDYTVASSRSIAYYKYVWEKIGGYPEWLTLAADDTNFWKQIEAQGFKFVFTREPRVYWLRHQRFSGFAHETFRYGLGDGESHINQRNTASHIVETLLRYSLFLILILLAFKLIIITAIFYLVIVIQLFGLRSYLNAFSNWWKLKSPKYHIGIFFASLWLTELSRMYYLRGYFKGWFKKK